MIISRAWDLPEYETEKKRTKRLLLYRRDDDLAVDGSEQMRPVDLEPEAPRSYVVVKNHAERNGERQFLFLIGTSGLVRKVLSSGPEIHAHETQTSNVFLMSLSAWDLDAA